MKTCLDPSAATRTGASRQEMRESRLRTLIAAGVPAARAHIACRTLKSTVATLNALKDCQPCQRPGCTKRCPPKRHKKANPYKYCGDRCAEFMREESDRRYDKKRREATRRARLPSHRIVGMDGICTVAPASWQCDRIAPHSRASRCAGPTS